MEIVWYGLSCFKMAERGSATVVTDPYVDPRADHAPFKVVADIVTLSHTVPGPADLETISGAPYTILGPGEYEVGGVFITGIQTGGQKGSERVQIGVHNTLYTFDFNSLTIAHLGNLDRILTQSEIEAIGTVNVALVPIGGEHALNAARAAEVINQLDPNIVVPMAFASSGETALDSLNKFLKEMGLGEVGKQPSLKVSSASLPEETQVIVLECQRE